MDRDELHDLVISLREKLAAGKLVLRDPGVLHELSEVRFADDGKVDPATVGSSVRATAYASAAADASRAMEQISLQEVQSRYFEILENNFGSTYSEMKRRSLNPQVTLCTGVAYLGCNIRQVVGYAIQKIPN